MHINERSSYASNERAEPRDSEINYPYQQKKDIFTSFGGNGEFDRRLNGNNPTITDTRVSI